MSESPSRVQGYLADARGGDRQAREQLFAMCRSYLTLIARASVTPRLQTKLDASDLVQQTMLDAHRNFADFQGRTEQEWLAWLRAILQHNAVDAARFHFDAEKRALGKEQALQSPSQTFRGGIHDLPATSDPSPSEYMILAEQSLLLAEAIERLSPEYHEVIVLRNIMRLSFNEIAERLDRSRAAAQMLWMRAVQQLREQLHEVGATSLFERRT